MRRVAILPGPKAPRSASRTTEGQPSVAVAQEGPTIKRTIHFAPGRRGAHRVKHGPPPEAKVLPKAAPRLARLMAFAIVFEEWLASGKVKDYAELASITGLDRSRITRIMNLRLLEPGEQEGRLGRQENG